MRKKPHAHVRRVVLERDGPYCRYCGAPAKAFGWRKDANDILRIFVDGMCFDHYVPAKVGGASTVENLVLACESCNAKKSAGAPPPLRPPCPFKLGGHSTMPVRDWYSDRGSSGYAG